MFLKILAGHFGVSKYIIKHCLASLGFSIENLCKKSNTFSESELLKLEQFIVLNYKVDLKLREHRAINIKTLKALNTYKGLRHIYRLPVNGQRTKTNAKTRKKK